MIRIGRRRIDALLLITVTVLVVFGVVMIFSASYYDTISKDKWLYTFLIKAAFWSGSGFVIMMATALVPKLPLKKVAPLMMVATWVCLILVFTPVGVTINGASRWIGVGSFTFMPGELAKPAIIFFFAFYYSEFAKRVKSFKYGFAYPGLVIAVTFILIYMQPNLSTAVIIAATALAMMFVAGVRSLYVFGFAGISAAGIVYKVMSDGGEHMNRVVSFINPLADAQGESYQVVQGLLALGSGGLTGSGLGGSVQKALWLPEASNDFILAIIGEETGFIGCLLLIIAFVVLIWRCAVITVRTRDRYSMLLGAGITVLFSLQIILNIAVVTSLCPPTGVILPFISYGGNAMLSIVFMMGVMLRLSGDTVPKSRAKKKKKNKRGKGRGAGKGRDMEVAA